jgi:hypothetical protein
VSQHLADPLLAKQLNRNRDRLLDVRRSACAGCKGKLPQPELFHPYFLASTRTSIAPDHSNSLVPRVFQRAKRGLTIAFICRASTSTQLASGQAVHAWRLILAPMLSDDGRVPGRHDAPSASTSSSAGVLRPAQPDVSQATQEYIAVRYFLPQLCQLLTLSVSTSTFMLVARCSEGNVRTGAISIDASLSVMRTLQTGWLPASGANDRDMMSGRQRSTPSVPRGDDANFKIRPLDALAWRATGYQ